MVVQKQSTGLLGGSFDPVHNGHVAIARSFLKSSFINDLWVLPSPDPPHKQNETVASYKHRLAMVQLAFEGIDRIVVSEVEHTLPSPSYTIHTLEYLHETYPDNTFFLCIGSDSLHEFTQWHRWQDILGLCDLLIARRPGEQSTSLVPLVKQHAHFVPHQAVNISSTELREKASQNQTLSSFVPPQVERYIHENKLYKR